MRPLLLALGILLLVAPVRAAEEVHADLTWVVGEPNRYTLREYLPGKKAPAGVEAPVPGEDFVWARAILGPDRTLLLAARFGDDRDDLWVDRDLDGELTDEEPVSLVRSGSTAQTIVSLDLVLPGEEEPREIPVRFTHHFQSTRGCLHVAVPVHREGEVVLEGRARKVALFSARSDLDFDTGNPRLSIDADGDGQVSCATNSPDAVRPGAPFRVNDSGWVASVSGTGTVTIAPASEVPPVVPPTRPNYSRPAAGRKAPGAAKTLAEYRKDYDEAEEADRKLNATWTSNRQRVLREAAPLGTGEAMAWLQSLLKKERQPNLAAEVVRALGYQEYLSAADRVADLLTGSRESQVRAAAIEALHGMGAPDRETLIAGALAEATDSTLANAAARHLAYLGTESALLALAAAVTAPKSDDQQYAAYDAIFRYGPKAPPPALVLAAARSTHSRLRALGIDHARDRGLPEARELALTAVRDEEAPKEVRIAAAETLGRRGDPEAAAAVLAAIAHAQPEVRARAVELLSLCRDPKTVEIVIGSLSDASPWLRAAAAEILGGIRGESAAAALADRLDSEKDPDVLAAVLAALARTGADAAADAILKVAGRRRLGEDVLRSALDALADIGLGNPRVRKLFADLADSKEWTERVLVLDAATSTGDPVAADLLLPALTDKVWQVRLAAAQGLARIRVRRAIEPLIGRLEEEESQRVRQAAANALFMITGRNFYDIAELWRKWWAEAGETFEVPPSPPEPKEDDGHGGSVADFYGVPVDSDRIVFVIDQSGSMSSDSGTPGKNKLEVAKEQTIKVAEKLEKGSRVNVILFETTVHPWQKQLVPMTPRSLATLKNHLENKQPTGGTNLYDALEMAILTPGVDTIYLLSDGSPGSGKFVQADDIVREVRRLNQTRRIAIHCISLGMDSQLLKRLADEHGGRYARR